MKQIQYILKVVKGILGALDHRIVLWDMLGPPLCEDKGDLSPLPRRSIPLLISVCPPSSVFSTWRRHCPRIRYSITNSLNFTTR